MNAPVWERRQVRPREPGVAEEEPDGEGVSSAVGDLVAVVVDPPEVAVVVVWIGRECQPSQVDVERPQRRLQRVALELVRDVRYRDRGDVADTRRAPCQGLTAAAFRFRAIRNSLSAWASSPVC